ncbi:ribosomal RNA small subunit methyltransferase E [bacterium BMS3Bbin14]|nr:ribosomal RNA small subunit methyltransferase E [bacterium BMS3Abin13]GBE52953.1 ribosomal RNA small subunit methyltransferase E [bacterium BMS3Bbin14]HDK44084.1 16S rRNA (uracil(1498)-N(3))-methyltransferase [Desulfobacteraceae bacterium]HDZ76144.1 16S rRNA (uracil(1498)-N(3))-methyltransferase [Desulfobacteraceae bacterium]
MRRFFIDPGSISARRAVISAAESRHIATVLRLQPGVCIELFDGTGTVYQGCLHSVTRQAVTVDILSRQQPAEEGVPLILAQGLLKGKKMDFLVQKATELGVRTFQPLQTRYCENKGERQSRQDRWRRIMLEACKQCKRLLPMEINPTVGLNHLDTSQFSRKIMLWEDEKSVPLPGALPSADSDSICLLLGPEGGFHQEEIEYARALGFQTVSLGRRTLRAETAALAAVAIVQFLSGNLDPA